MFICFLILQQFHFHIRTEYEIDPQSHSHKNYIFRTWIMREEVKLDTFSEWTKSIGSLILETEILSEFLTKISI